MESKETLINADKGARNNYEKATGLDFSGLKPL